MSTLGDKEHLLPDDLVREDLAATVFEEKESTEVTMEARTYFECSF
jgi:hypothetical protein